MLRTRMLLILAALGAPCAVAGAGVQALGDLRPQEGYRDADRAPAGRGEARPQPAKRGRDGDEKRREGERDDAAGRLAWWRQRLGGDLGPEFMARYMREAERQRLLYPDQFPPPGSASRDLPEGTPLGVAIAATTWTNLGPTRSNKIQNGVTLTAVNSGRLRTILPDPTDANVLYLLTSGGGLWKTSNLLDATPTWTSLSDRIGSDMGGAAAFGRPVSGAYTTLYLGLGDAFDNGVGGFFVKSSDGGATWSSAVQLTGTIGATTYTATRVLDLKVDSSGATDIILVGTDVGLFRSTDAGVSFTLVNNASLYGRLVWSLAKTSAGWLAATQTLGSPRLGALLVSANLGATWAPTTTQLPTSTASVPGTDPAIAAGRITLAVGAPGDTTVYAFAAYSTTTTVPFIPSLASDYAQYDLFYSTDGGQTWTATRITQPSTGGSNTPVNPNPDQPDLDIMAGQAFYNHMILVDPADASRNTVYLGGQLSTAYTTNAKAASFGSSWRILTNWLPGSYPGAPPGGTAGVPYAHADFHCAAFTNAGGTERLLFGNDGGVAIGTNRAGFWNTWDHSKNVGIVSHLVYALASGPLSNCEASSVVAGLQDNGVHNRIGATSVFDQTKGGDGFGVGWSQSAATTVLSSYVYNQISRATVNPADQGNWSAFTTGLPGTPGGDPDYYFVTPIITPSGAADPAGTAFFTYSGPAGGGSGSAGNRIFKSSATQWNVIARADGTNTPGLTTGRFVRPVSHGVGVHPTDINRIAAACNGGVVILTTNGGASWTERNLGALVPASGSRTWQGFNASVTWVDSSTLFACSESLAPNSIHVARSTDGGATWSAAETGLPDLPVTRIVADPGDSATLYAATWLGVHRTTDGGATWSLFGTGLPQALVSDLYIHPQGGFLRASIYGRGLWQVGPTPTYAAPSISASPAGGAFMPGTPFTLTGAISNPYPPPAYQWRRNGVPLANGGPEAISGATTPSLTVGSPVCGSAGDYSLHVTNCVGSAVSGVATLTTAAASPVITTHPANLRYATNATFTLSVAATGTGLTYQWRRAGVNLTNTAPYSGVTTNTLTVTSAGMGVAGTFDCVVTVSGGCSVTSNPASVAQATVPPNILSHPANASVTAPASTTFTVAVGGGRVGGNVTLNFQWRRNGTNLTHGTGGYAWLNTSTGTATTSNGTGNLTVNNSTGRASSTLTVNPTSDAMNGAVYDCVVTNPAGNATSAGAKLTVLRQYTPATAVSITPSVALPASRSGAGWPVTFTAAGSGSVLQGVGTPAPAGAYQYQFWLYLDDNLGWTMVQDYGVGTSYTLPTTMQPGTYGIGVDCRTSPQVLWDVFNAIDYFDITPMRVPGGEEAATTPSRPGRPPFRGGPGAVQVRVDPAGLGVPAPRGVLK